MPDAVEVTSRTSNFDGLQDPYDHEIFLVDTLDAGAERSSDQLPAPRLAQKASRTGTRDPRAERKFARYTYERYSKTARVATDEATDGQGPTEAQPEYAAPQPNQTGPADLVPQTRKSEKKKGAQKGPVAEIDLLYENQRGSFMFGMPLYSHSSLLNFDPAPWVTKDFKDSPVNITNAQVPDPTWEWAWKTWYVDMSYDVDEQGWQYSFSFRKNATWHGNHPWFHSFVRRRRWLRKRIKKEQGTLSPTQLNTQTSGHHLTPDYFTIHQARGPNSQGSNLDNSISQPHDEANELPEDMKNIGNLIQALKLARVDREKMEIVTKFINESGQELVYLKQVIPEILSLFVFQSSKQQFLAYLELAAKEAKKHREKDINDLSAEDETEKQRIDDLLATVEAVNQEITRLDFWSDRRHVLSTIGLKPWHVKPAAPLFDALALVVGKRDESAGETEGVSSMTGANVNTTDHIAVKTSQQAPSDRRDIEEGKAKGKGKEKQQGDP